MCQNYIRLIRGKQQDTKSWDIQETGGLRDLRGACPACKACGIAETRDQAGMGWMSEGHELASQQSVQVQSRAVGGSTRI